MYFTIVDWPLVSVLCSIYWFHRKLFGRECVSNLETMANASESVLYNSRLFSWHEVLGAFVPEGWSPVGQNELGTQSHWSSWEQSMCLGWPRTPRGSWRHHCAWNQYYKTLFAISTSSNLLAVHLTKLHYCPSQRDKFIWYHTSAINFLNNLKC